PSALPRRDEVTRDRLGTDDEPARSESLHDSARDELREILAEGARQRAGEEHDDRRLEEKLPAVEIAELPEDRSCDRCRRDVRRDDPGESVELADVADDRRQRGREDGLVERG